MKYRCIVFSRPWRAGGRGPGALGMLRGLGTKFWECFVGLVSRVLRMLGGIGTEFWACSVGLVPRVLGMLGGVGTQHA